MAVDTPQGRRYTRDGHLRMDADRRLVTSGGHPVLDDRGREIVLPAGSQDAPNIATDGTVTMGQQQLGKIDLVRSEEHTSELQSLMRISYAVFCLKNTKTKQPNKAT